MVGVPQPSFAIGPIRKRPSIGGKMRFRSPMMRGAFATMSCGKSTLLSEPSRTPARSGSKRIVRLSPISPPTPISVKPKPSWIGGNSAEMMMSSEKPGWPSGSLVLRMPTAWTSIVPWNLSSSPPAYSPFRIEIQEAAALEAAAVERQADAVRRLEAERRFRTGRRCRLRTRPPARRPMPAP